MAETAPSIFADDGPSPVKVERLGAKWVCRCTFEERFIPKGAGFRWDPTERHWFTTDGQVAARLLSPAEAAAAKHAEEEKFKLRCEAVLESIAEDTDFFVPAPRPELVYRPYQRAGVSLMVKRPFVLQADDMGLGKTIQVAGAINVLEQEEKLKKILIICPNSLRINWLRELKKWLVNYHSIAVWNSETCRPSYVDISIIHYDVVAKWARVLRSVAWDLTVGDECHLLKNTDTLRARAVLGIDKRTATRLENLRQEKLRLLPGTIIPPSLRNAIEPMPPLRGARAIMMTGTPLPNRPKEGFPVFHYLDPQTFRSKSGFEREFCDAEFNGYGMEADGGSNLAQLQVLLRSTIMIRRRKEDVLKDLPAKQRSVIEIPHGAKKEVEAELQAYKATEAQLAAARVAAAEAKKRASENPDAYAAAVRSLRAGRVAAFSQISKQRHDTAMAKIPYLIDHLKGLLEAGEKLIVFVHHHELVDAIRKEFGAQFVTCYGRDEADVRQRNVDRFQQDPKVRGIVGSYPVMGVGWTLTASSHVVLGELDWVPGNVKQAEDRAHRMGQTDSVLCEHLVLEGSLEAYMAHVVVEKLEMQTEALDMEVPVGVAEFAAREAPVGAPARGTIDSATLPPEGRDALFHVKRAIVEDAEQVGFEW